MTVIVEMTGVSKRYVGPPPVAALIACDLTIDEGDFLTVTGASGSGKSTLLNILGLLDDPTEGTYRLHGRATGGLSETERSRLRGTSIGFVFQSFHLLEQRTCVDNVALAGMYTGESERQSRTRALAALTAVGLENRTESYPTELSGGQQQRVAIARGIATSPDLLLCDEPTGNLDSIASSEVLALLKGLNSNGRTIVLITHDPELAREGSRRLVLHDGAIHEAQRRELM